MGVLNLAYPAVMGVLNLTPDSFSDGGRFTSLDAARRRAVEMASEGAAIIDIGGESTRPGAAEITEQQELDRVIPVIEALASDVDTPLSIDTSKPGVMRAAAAAGAALINDIRALQGDGALAEAVNLQLPVCLMHMQGDPQNMQSDPTYTNVTAEVSDFLAERVAVCVAAGLRRDQLLVDPGFGFGKTPQQNIELLANLRQLQEIGCPLVTGLSRKATLGAITGRAVDQRRAASVAAAVIALLNGAAVIRAHDVADTLDAIKVASSVMAGGTPGAETS